MNALFESICVAESGVAAIAGLSDAELAGLAAWLRAGHGRGIQGLVLGLCELEASERFWAKQA